MRIIDAIPGYSDSSFISSIINMVCPLCGGSVVDYQCHGRCGRNWLPEWEWVNTTGSTRR